MGLLFQSHPRSLYLQLPQAVAARKIIEADNNVLEKDVMGKAGTEEIATKTSYYYSPDTAL